MKNKITATIAILFILLFNNFAFAEETIKPITINIADEYIEIILSSNKQLEINDTKKKEILIFEITPSLNEDNIYEVDRGLIQTIQVNSNKNLTKIKVFCISPAQYKITEFKKDSTFKKIIKIAQTEVYGKAKSRSIKTVDNYESGKSLMTDMAVILESSSDLSAKSKGQKKQKAGFLPQKVLIGEKKAGFKDNIKIMLSNNKKPEPVKAGKTMSDLKNILDFVPLEKSEVINKSFNDKSYATIIKYLGEKSGKNVIIAPSVKGKKSIEFEDMSPEEAISALLNGTNYEFKIMKNTIFVAPNDVLETLTKKQDIFDTSTDIKKKEVFVLKYVRGEKAIKALEKNFPQAEYTFHSKLNAFEVIADQETLDEIDEMLEYIDEPEANENKIVRELKLNEYINKKVKHKRRNSNI